MSINPEEKKPKEIRGDKARTKKTLTWIFFVCGIGVIIVLIILGVTHFGRVTP